MGVTIRDVAQAAGVSIATVSRALRGHPAISEKTTEHVKAVAEELNYDVSTRVGPHLSTTKPVRVAVVLPYIGRWYFAKIVEGIERVVVERGYETVLLRPRDLAHHPKSISEHLDAFGIEGAIVVSLSPQAEAFDDLLTKRIPTVLIDIQEPRFTQVRIDNIAVGRLATEHLLQLRHKNIAIVTGDPNEPLNFSTPNDRRKGYLQALQRSGITPKSEYEAYADFTAKSADAAATRLLELQDPPTAIFAASDEMAYGVLSAARRLGIQVPEELSIIGVDDHELSESFGLTTIAQPVETLAEMAAWQLLSRMSASEIVPNEIVTLPVTLVERSSTLEVAVRND